MTFMTMKNVETDLSVLEERLQHRFARPELLLTALTHSSYLNEHGLKKEECNERLEFLGDAVLEMLSSEVLYSLFPEDREGSLSKKRATLVCEEGLAVSARELGLGEFLRLGVGAYREKAYENDSVLSDAFEAVLAAVYLDGGLEEAGKLVREHVVNDIERKLIYNDAKTVLQELLVRKNLKAEYVLVSESGPDHDKTFVSLCRVGGQDCGQGTGHTKKASEQEAARETIRILKEENTCI